MAVLKGPVLGAVGAAESGEELSVTDVGPVAVADSVMDERVLLESVRRLGAAVLLLDTEGIVVSRLGALVLCSTVVLGAILLIVVASVGPPLAPLALLVVSPGNPFVVIVTNPSSEVRRKEPSAPSGTKSGSSGSLVVVGPSGFLVVSHRSGVAAVGSVSAVIVVVVPRVDLVVNHRSPTISRPTDTSSGRVVGGLVADLVPEVAFSPEVESEGEPVDELGVVSAALGSSVPALALGVVASAPGVDLVVNQRSPTISRPTDVSGSLVVDPVPAIGSSPEVELEVVEAGVV